MSTIKNENSTQNPGQTTQLLAIDQLADVTGGVGGRLQQVKTGGTKLISSKGPSDLWANEPMFGQ